MTSSVGALFFSDFRLANQPIMMIITSTHTTTTTTNIIIVIVVVSEI